MTQESTGSLAKIHDRMPVFLQGPFLDAWLDTKHYSFRECQRFLSKRQKVFVRDHVESYEVSDKVNSVRNQGPELLLPIKQA